MTDPLLTIGMPVYDDARGAQFTLQALRMYHDLDGVELLVIDNHPDSLQGKRLKAFCGQASVRYERFTESTGTAQPRNELFRQARGTWVLCMDAHVFLDVPGLRRLIADLRQLECGEPVGFERHDLLSGPIVFDSLQCGASAYVDTWGAGSRGRWNYQLPDADAAPFPIEAMGLGLFVARREDWLGFLPSFQGWGGEEWYIFAAYRQAGRRTLCLPWLRWWHDFRQPFYPNPCPSRRRDTIANYIEAAQALGESLDDARRHFVKELKVIGTAGWNRLVRAPHSGRSRVRGDRTINAPTTAAKPTAAAPAALASAASRLRSATADGHSANAIDRWKSTPSGTPS